MVVKVAGFWEHSWTVPYSEWNLWDFPLREFNVDEFIMSPVTGINKKVTEYASIEEILIINSTLTPVYVDENADTWMEGFIHPKNALYILGRAGYAPYNAVASDPNTISVKVRTPTNLGMSWGHQIICIILYDRMIKSGN